MFALALAAAQAGKTRSGHSVRAGPAAAGGASPHFERGCSLSSPTKWGRRAHVAGPARAAAPGLLGANGGKVCGAPAPGARSAWRLNFDGQKTLWGRGSAGAGVAFVPHPCLLRNLRPDVLGQNRNSSRGQADGKGAASRAVEPRRCRRRRRPRSRRGSAARASPQSLCRAGVCRTPELRAVPAGLLPPPSALPSLVLRCSSPQIHTLVF